MTVAELFDFFQSQYGSSWQAVIESHGGVDQAVRDWSRLDLGSVVLKSKPFFKLRDTHPVTRGAPTMQEFDALLKGDWAAPLGIPKYDEFIRLVRGEREMSQRVYRAFYFDLLREIRKQTGNSAVEWIRSRINPNSIRSRVQPIYQSKREEFVRKPWQPYQREVHRPVNNSVPKVFSEQDRQAGRANLNHLKDFLNRKQGNVA